MESNNKDVKKQDDKDIVKERELPYLFEKELIINQNRRLCSILNDYIPVEKAIPITLKFYSKYDQDLINIKSEKNLKHFNRINLLQSGPKGKYGKIILESHTYGWLSNIADYEKLYELNVTKKSKKRCDLTIFNEKIVSERQTERPAYYGSRFFL